MPTNVESVLKSWLKLTAIFFYIAHGTNAAAIHARKDIPLTPTDVTLVRLSSVSAHFRWSYRDHPDTVLSYEVTLRPVKGKVTEVRKKEVIDGYIRECTVDRLPPDTEFSVTVVAKNKLGVPSNASDVIMFRTLAGFLSSNPPAYRMRMHMAEMVLIALIVGAWAGAIALFLNRWGRIRIVQNRDFNYRHKPKNLDQIKIVKRPTESVIYRTYPTNMANTLEAREKRLQRMRTMPNIKVSIGGLESALTPETETGGGMGCFGGDSGSTSKCVPLLDIHEEQQNEMSGDATAADAPLSPAASHRLSS